MNVVNIEEKLSKIRDHWKVPVADDEAHVLLFEPSTTVNTGNAGGERTVIDLPRV